MSVRISNVKNYGDGLCEYAVEVKDERIAYFTHKRKHGLAVCLRKASQAVQEANKRKGRQGHDQQV